MKKYLLTLAREPSTWRGLVAILTAAGVTLNPDQIAAIVALGLSIAGGLGAFLPDKKPDA